MRLEVATLQLVLDDECSRKTEAYWKDCIINFWSTLNLALGVAAASPLDTSSSSAASLLQYKASLWIKRVFLSDETT